MFPPSIDLSIKNILPNNAESQEYIDFYQSIDIFLYFKKKRACNRYISQCTLVSLFSVLNALFHLVEGIVVFAVGIALFVTAVFQRTFDNFIFIFFAFDDTDHDCKADNGYTKGFEHG